VIGFTAVALWNHAGRILSSLPTVYQCGSISTFGDGKLNKVRSDFLFAKPSFISGAARVLDLYGIYDAYNASSTEREADYKALVSDWHMVGQDIFNAMEQFAYLLSPGSVAHYNERSADDRQMSFFH
jgi:hypothetical protein